MFTCNINPQPGKHFGAVPTSGMIIMLFPSTVFMLGFSDKTHNWVFFGGWEGSLLPLVHLQWQDANPKLWGASRSLGATSKRGFHSPFRYLLQYLNLVGINRFLHLQLEFLRSQNVSQTHFLHPSYELVVKYTRISFPVLGWDAHPAQLRGFTNHNHQRSCRALRPTRTTKLLFQTGTVSICHQQCLLCSYTALKWSLTHMLLI